MKRLKLFIFMLILIIIIQGVWRSRLDFEYTKSFEKNIGNLVHHIRPYERDILDLVYFRIKSMEQNRVARDEPIMTTDEENLRIHFNAQINGLTKKYLLEEELKIIDNSLSINKDQYRRLIISNLLELVESSDRDELQRATDLYMESRRSFYLDAIRDILDEYENIDTGILVMQLQNPIDINAFFRVNPQLQYMDRQPFLISGLSSEEVSIYEEIWKEITRIFPRNITEEIDGLVIYSGDKNTSELYINQKNYGNNNIYINRNVVLENGELSSEFYKEVIKEISFLIMTREGQAEYRERPSMTRYFQNGMLAIENSYLNQFYTRYWKGILIDSEISKSIGIEDGTYLFYLRHKDHFTSYLSARGPMEDLAESLSRFILEDKPRGNNIWEQKTRFFYEFPELITMKTNIRRALQLEI